MKKYTIDDLIIDEPISETKKGERKPKSKYTTVTLIAIILIAVYFLTKIITGSSTDINATKETKTADATIKELLEPKQEAQEAASDLSLAITELDSLAPPTIEPKIDETIAVKTGELPETKQDTNESAVQELQKTSDELSIAGAETKSMDLSAVETKNNETIAVKTGELPETKQDTNESAEQEPQKITDVLPNATTETKSTEPSATEPDIDAMIAARIEELPEQKEEAIVPAAEEEAQKVADELSAPTTETISQDILKNSTPDTVVSQKKPEIKEEKTEQPKQETKSRVTKTEESASVKEKEKKKDVTDKKKVKSESKPKSKQDGFLNIFSKKAKYYILVGSNPSSKFLSKIKNAKLPYVIRTSKGKRSVFIGPYSSSSSAKHSIGKVQKVTGVKGVVVKAK